MPYLRALSSFRDDVRTHAIGKQDNALLVLCDKLRDSDMVPLGVALDDQEGTESRSFFFPSVSLSPTNLNDQMARH